MIDIKINKLVCNNITNCNKRIGMGIENIYKKIVHKSMLKKAPQETWVKDTIIMIIL